jgi:hypothetical protein
MSGYFESFPTGVYANTQCVDLTRRAALRRSIVADPRVYLPYELRDGERLDQVAQHYYGSADHTWMVYMSGEIVDPYHEAYLDQNSFEQHVAAKYGSYENSVRQTAYWQLNWGADEEHRLDPSGYDALDDQLKKYWDAVYGTGSQVVAYKRREEDWVVSTNMVVSMGVAVTSNALFSVGDVLDVYASNGVTLSGQAEVAWVDGGALGSNGVTQTVKVIHVGANTDPGAVLKGALAANGVVTSRTYVSNSIPVDERSYWSRVSRYDHEYGQNEQRKHIRLVDRKYVNQMKTQLPKVLAANTRSR